MSQSTATSERITAIVSTLVAVIILAAAVTGHQPRMASRDDLVPLESDLRFQLEMAFRHDTGQLKERVDQLDRVLEAWQQSPQSEEDLQLFAFWLRAATVRSMPGSIKSLPTAPLFGQSVPAVEQVPMVSITEPVSPPVEVKQEKRRSALRISEVPLEIQRQVSVDDSPFLERGELSSGSSAAKLRIEEPRVIIRPIEAVQTKVDRPSTEDAETGSAAHSQLTTFQAEKQVHVNLAELTARIAGYHDRLDEMELALFTPDRSDVAWLANQVRQLEQLATEFRFVKLYYEVLTGAERQTMLPPRSLDAVLDELQRQLDQNERTQDGDFLGLFDTAEQKQIAELRQQLTAISDRVGR